MEVFKSTFWLCLCLVGLFWFMFSLSVDQSVAIVSQFNFSAWYDIFGLSLPWTLDTGGWVCGPSDLEISANLPVAFFGFDHSVAQGNCSVMIRWVFSLWNSLLKKVVDWEVSLTNCQDAANCLILVWSLGIWNSGSRKGREVYCSKSNWNLTKIEEMTHQVPSCGQWYLLIFAKRKCFFRQLLFFIEFSLILTFHIVSCPKADALLWRLLLFLRHTKEKNGLHLGSFSDSVCIFLFSLLGVEVSASINCIETKKQSGQCVRTLHNNIR